MNETPSKPGDDLDLKACGIIQLFLQNDVPNSRVLFPEFINRTIRATILENENILLMDLEAAWDGGSTGIFEEFYYKGPLVKERTRKRAFDKDAYAEAGSTAYVRSSWMTRLKTGTSMIGTRNVNKPSYDPAQTFDSTTKKTLWLIKNAQPNMTEFERKLCNELFERNHVATPKQHIIIGRIYKKYAKEVTSAIQ